MITEAAVHGSVCSLGEITTHTKSHTAASWGSVPCRGILWRVGTRPHKDLLDESKLWRTHSVRCKSHTLNYHHIFTDPVLKWTLFEWTLLILLCTRVHIQPHCAYFTQRRTWSVRCVFLDDISEKVRFVAAWESSERCISRAHFSITSKKITMQTHTTHTKKWCKWSQHNKRQNQTILGH